MLLISKIYNFCHQVIASNKTDPHPWTQYAIFLKKIGDIERAKECCLEAITLNHQHAMAYVKHHYPLQLVININIK